jgi:hypothetical protein
MVFVHQVAIALANREIVLRAEELLSGKKSYLYRVGEAGPQLCSPVTRRPRMRPDGAGGVGVIVLLLSLAGVSVYEPGAHRPSGQIPLWTKS